MAVHRFEKAGLGKAPFRLVKSFQHPAWYRIYDPETGLTHEGKGGTCCDYCGTYILLECTIESADGKVFKVGSDCAAKTNDRKLTIAANAAAKKANRFKRHARERKQIRDGYTLLAQLANRKVLRGLPHPLDWRAEKGDTMLDQVRWMLRHAGNAGKIRTIKAMKKIIIDYPTEPRTRGSNGK